MLSYVCTDENIRRYTSLVLCFVSIIIMLICNYTFNINLCMYVHMQMDDTMITSTTIPDSTEIDDKEDDGDKVNNL